jgi:hypothetical protein
VILFLEDVSISERDFLKAGKGLKWKKSTNSKFLTRIRDEDLFSPEAQSISKYPSPEKKDGHIQIYSLKFRVLANNRSGNFENIRNRIRGDPCLSVLPI